MANASTEYVSRYPKEVEARYAPFRFGSAAAALAIALTAGFGAAAAMSAYVGFELSVGGWWLSVLQAHGHAQVAGWLGLFIIGVSLYFVPRLSGAPLTPRPLAGAVVLLYAAGVILRTGSQPLLSASTSMWLRGALGLSGVLEAAAVAGYLALLIRAVSKAKGREALASVRPFFVTAFVGWAVWGALNAWLAFSAAGSVGGFVDIAMNRLAIDLFSGLTLLPVAMAFSVRTFPLYLRLPAADWPVRALAIAYVATFLVEKAGAVTVAAGLSDAPMPVLEGVGRLAKGAILLVFIYKLDVLTRFAPPWTVKRIGAPGTDRRPTRPGLPDYGEFGRFEWLLYLAYAWLVVAAVCEAIVGYAGVTGSAPLVDPDALRHIYLAGYMSSLLLGMAPRMIPGFLHRRSTAHPTLVAVTFWLWLPAVLFRVLPLLLGPWLPVAVLPGVQIAFGISGALGWLAIVALTVNLVRTARS